MTKILVLLIFVPLAATAQEFQDRGWFLGTEAGQADKDNADTDYMGGLFGGFQFTPYFALEGGYQVFGDFSSPSLGGLAVDSSVEGWKLLAVGMLPIRPRFSLTGKAGLLFNESDEVTRASIGNAIQHESDDSGPALELGIRYRLTQGFWLELAYGYYSLDFFNVTVSDGSGSVNVDFEDDALEVIKLGLSFFF